MDPLAQRVSAECEEHDPADHLGVVVTLAQGPLGRLADRREGFGQQVVEGLALVESLAIARGQTAQVGVREPGLRAFEDVHLLDERKQSLDRAIVARAEDLAEDSLHRPVPASRLRSPRRRGSGASPLYG